VNSTSETANLFATTTPSSRVRIRSGIVSAKAEKMDNEPLQETGKIPVFAFTALSIVIVTTSAKFAAAVRFSGEAFGRTIVWGRRFSKTNIL
jgi:hypothetical protein